MSVYKDLSCRLLAESIKITCRFNVDWMVFMLSLDFYCLFFLLKGFYYCSCSVADCSVFFLNDSKSYYCVAGSQVGLLGFGVLEGPAT